MPQITIKQLLEAGVHFGHQTQRWNPKMKKYIFGERNGIYIINLEITLTCMDHALRFLKQLAAEGKNVLWVGTKKQAQESIREGAKSCKMPYVEERWLGGMLTNFETVRKSVQRLEAIEQMEKEGSFQFITKKETGVIKKEHEKLCKNLAGVREMTKLPGAIFVIDSENEEIAIKEAYKLKIPVIAVLDTNADPDLVDYPIPGNDDAIRAIKLFCEAVAGAIREGRTQFEQGMADKRPKEDAVDVAIAQPSEQPAEPQSEKPDVDAPSLSTVKEDEKPLDVTAAADGQGHAKHGKTNPAIKK
ncbi:MAG: 30S ribosomal protein S2 [Candidatus Omnitrophica bacterium]|nr:30S ribosomal protein S2 [Candidatus Omnitrophota bacterium]